MSFNNTLVFLRNKHGLTQEQLANAVGVSQAVISMYESGIKVPSIFVSVKLAKTFGITVEELAEGNLNA